MMEQPGGNGTDTQLLDGGFSPSNHLLGLRIFRLVRLSHSVRLTVCLSLPLPLCLCLPVCLSPSLSRSNAFPFSLYICLSCVSPSLAFPLSFSLSLSPSLSYAFPSLYKSFCLMYVAASFASNTYMCVLMSVSLVLALSLSPSLSLPPFFRDGERRKTSHRYLRSKERPYTQNYACDVRFVSGRQERPPASNKNSYVLFRL